MLPDKNVPQATQPHQMINLRDLTSYLDKLKRDIKLETLDLAYPIGSIYTSDSSTDPSRKLGFGTWTRIEGRFIVGASDSDGDFDLNDTGGAKTVATSNHTHSVDDADSTAAGKFTGSASGGTNPKWRRIATPTWSGNIQASGGWNAAGYSGSQSTGMALVGATASDGGETLNKLPPYKAKYMWERTA